MKDLGDETIVGITDLVSGEKDPRNLMIVFSILRVIMVEWDISGHAEVLRLLYNFRTWLTQQRHCLILSSAIFPLRFVPHRMIHIASRRKISRLA